MSERRLSHTHTRGGHITLGELIGFTKEAMAAGFDVSTPVDSSGGWLVWVAVEESPSEAERVRRVGEQLIQAIGRKSPQ